MFMYGSFFPLGSQTSTGAKPKKAKKKKTKTNKQKIKTQTHTDTFPSQKHTISIVNTDKNARSWPLSWRVRTYLIFLSCNRALRVAFAWTGDIDHARRIWGAASTTKKKKITTLTCSSLKGSQYKQGVVLVFLNKLSSRLPAFVWSSSSLTTSSGAFSTKTWKT